MPEKENKEIETLEVKEACGCKRKGCFCHKIFGLKGLSMIYKVLSWVVLAYMVYVVGTIWYIKFAEKVTTASEALILTAQVIITLGFYALVLFTVARVLKVLKKIKHAVEHK
jgi:hypothetical protein